MPGRRSSADHPEPVPTFKFMNPFWMKLAACRKEGNTREGLDQFFPNRMSEKRADNITNNGIARTDGLEAAIKKAELCMECCVRRNCFEYAKATKTPDGVWGGKLFVRGKPVDILKMKRETS